MFLSRRLLVPAIVNWLHFAFTWATFTATLFKTLAIATGQPATVSGPGASVTLPRGLQSRGQEAWRLASLGRITRNTLQRTLVGWQWKSDDAQVYWNALIANESHV